VLRWSIALLLALAGAVTALLVIVALTLFAIYTYYARQLPPAERITAAEEEAFLTSVFYDRSGQMYYTK
jgi:hypothetical protein